MNLKELTESCPEPTIPSYQADHVSIGDVVRWINHEHMEAGKKVPCDVDLMCEWRKLSDGIEKAYSEYCYANRE